MPDCAAGSGSADRRRGWPKWSQTAGPGRILKPRSSASATATSSTGPASSFPPSPSSGRPSSTDTNIMPSIRPAMMPRPLTPASGDCVRAEPRSDHPGVHSGAEFHDWRRSAGRRHWRLSGRPGDTAAIEILRQQECSKSASGLEARADAHRLSLPNAMERLPGSC